MATIAYDQDAPGRGGSGPLFSSGSRMTKVLTGKFSFDNSYPTGGEDISEIFNYFNGATGVSRLDGMIIEQPIIAGAQTGKFIKVDFANKKLMLFTNASPFAEVGAASDQSAITNLRWIAWGAR